MEWDALGDTSLAVSPVSQEVVAQLYRLCCTDFSLLAFRQKWQEFGWNYQPASDDKFGFKVDINESLALTVAPEGEKVGCAYLAFCYWEEYEREWHETAKSYKAEKRIYDAVFDVTVKTCRLTLGQPWLVEKDQDKDAHRYTVWIGENGLLILQQCNFDLQFGLEINFWLEPIKASDFHPHSPLIDWLTARHQPQGEEQAL